MNELESFYVSTRLTAKAMGNFANQAKATCRQSCICDPDASAMNEDKTKGRLERWSKGSKKRCVTGTDSATPHSHSSASLLEFSSASRSQTLEPRTEADQSIPDPLPPSSYLLWGHSSRKPTQCEGINRVYCCKRCYCTINGAVSCDTTSTVTPNTSEKPMEESGASDSLRKRANYVTDMCHPFCRCEDGASRLLEPVKKSKEREREERERGKKARTGDLRRRSDNQIVGPLVRRSSHPISIADDRSNFPVPFPPGSPLQTRNDGPPNSKEALLPVPTWLPAPKFARPKPPKELICSGKDKPFCKDRCICNSDGTLLCNKKFQAALKSLVGIAAREQALGSLMNKMASVVAKCGVVCHCGNGFSDMGVGAVGRSEGGTTGVGFGGVGVGARFRTKVVGREGMTHGKAIMRRDEHTISSLLAAQGTSSSVPTSLHTRGGVGFSTKLPSLGLPGFLPSSGSLTGLVCTGLSMDRGFCDRRCRCTSSRTVVCDTLAQFQATTWTTPKRSRAEAEAMARGWTEGYTETCAPKCSCDGRKRKMEDMTSTDQMSNRHSPRLSPQNPPVPAVSSIHPRSNAAFGMKRPTRSNSQPLNRDSELSGSLQCAGQGSRDLDTLFCEARCQCTARGTVDCESESQAKAVELVKRKWSQEHVEMMTRKADAAITDECRAICNCGHILERPRLEDKDIKTTLQSSLNSSPSDSGSHDVSSIPHPLLHPRSGTLSSAAGTLSSTGESSNQPSRVTSPPTGDIKPRLKPKKYIECYSSDQSQLENCEAGCQCTPFGTITCDRYNEAAIEHAIKLATRKGTRTREWALLKITEHSLKQLVECAPICSCYDKPGVGNIRVATKTVKQSTKKTEATRDLSLPATGLLQPRSDTEVPIPEQPIPSKTPASSRTSLVRCAGANMEYGWNARHCEERCHCTSAEGVVCDGDATAEVAALKSSMGADDAEKFVDWNRATIASECTKVTCDLNLPHAIQGLRLRLSRQATDDKIRIYTDTMTSICSDRCRCHANAAPRIAADTTNVKVARLKPKPSLNPIIPRGIANSPGKVELVCTGSESRYCLQECYCAGYDIVKCDRNPPPMIQAFRNSMSEERAKREIATYISDLEGRCGHSCQCIAHGTKRRAESVLEHSHSIQPRSPPGPSSPVSPTQLTLACGQECRCVKGSGAYSTKKRKAEEQLSRLILPRSSVEVSRNDSRTPPAEASQLTIKPVDTAGLPLQPRSPAGPSTASVRPPLSPNPAPKKAIKVAQPTLRCGDMDGTKSIWCEDRCDCTPEGRLRCEKKSAGAIRAFTGTPSPEGGVITEKMAVELVMHASSKVVGLCSELCDCGKGPRGDTRERWRKQNRGGLSEVEFERHLGAPFDWGKLAGKDTAWTGKAGAQWNIPPSISVPAPLPTGTPAEPATASSSNQPPNPSTSSLQRRSAVRPPVVVLLHIECFDPKSHTCEKSCYCNPQGTISCNRNAAAAVEALSGTRIGDVVMTVAMAGQKVKAREVEMIKKCSGFCYCAEGPGKNKGPGYRIWLSRQRGNKPKAPLEKAENQAPVLRRALDGPSPFKPSARHGSSSRPQGELKHVKRLECVDAGAHTCQNSCHCDPVTGLVICDTLSEDASGVFAGSEGSPVTKQMGERIRTATLAQVQEVCGQLCQCVDRSGKGDKSQKVSGTRAQRAKQYAAMAIARVPRLALRGLEGPSTSEGVSHTESLVPSPPKVALKPAKQLLCVDPTSHTCETSCRCDPTSGEVTCDKKFEETMTILMSTTLPSGTLIPQEEAAARVNAKAAALAEKCAPFCYCVDKPGKSKQDEQEEWAAQMARGRKNLASGG